MDSVSLEKHLSVGQPVITELNPDAGDAHRHRFRTTIRGWSPDEFVLLDWPDESHEAHRIGRHMPCFVRYLHEGCACGFACKVAGQELVRRTQFEVTWPQKFEVMRIRQHDRIQVDVKGAIYGDSGEAFSGEVIDVSVGGCRLRLKKEISEGAKLEVTLPLHPGLEVERVPIEVCSVSPEQDNWVAGCKFGKLDPRTRHDIDFFIATAEERLRGMRGVARRVLLLDEDLDQLGKLRDFLSDAGYEVATAASLVDAFYRLRLAPPDALIVSGVLRELSAAEVCRIVRGTRGCKGLPIVLNYAGGTCATEAPEAAQGTASSLEEARLLIAALVPEPEHEEDHEEEA